MAKLEDIRSEVDRVREEKDAEIEVLQAGMDATIQQLAEAQQVSQRIYCL